MPGSRPARAIALAVAVVLPAARVAAQRETFHNTNAWFSTFGEVELAAKWALDYDVSLRMSGPLDELGQFLWRASIRRNITPNLRLAAGYAGSDTHPYGSLPIAYRTPEHRVFEQVQLSHAVGRAQLSHRYRIEQRWGGRVESVNGEASVQNWVRTSRARYLVRTTLPLQGATLDVGEWYVTVANEVFLNFGANVGQNVFDQNRIQGAIGRKLSRAMRLEVGFMDQLVERPSGRQLERNRVILTTLHTALKLPGRNE